MILIYFLKLSNRVGGYNFGNFDGRLPDRLVGMSGGKELICLIFFFILIPIFGTCAKINPTSILVAILSTRLSANYTAHHFRWYLHIHSLHGHNVVAETFVTRHFIIWSIFWVNPCISIIGNQIISIFFVGGII